MADELRDDAGDVVEPPPVSSKKLADMTWPEVIAAVVSDDARMLSFLRGFLRMAMVHNKLDETLCTVLEGQALIVALFRDDKAFTFHVIRDSEPGRVLWPHVEMIRRKLDEAIDDQLKVATAAAKASGDDPHAN